MTDLIQAISVPVILICGTLTSIMIGRFVARLLDFSHESAIITSGTNAVIFCVTYLMTATHTCHEGCLPWFSLWQSIALCVSAPLILPVLIFAVFAIVLAIKYSCSIVDKFFMTDGVVPEWNKTEYNGADE